MFDFARTFPAMRHAWDLFYFEKNRNLDNLCQYWIKDAHRWRYRVFKCPNRLLGVRVSLCYFVQIQISHFLKLYYTCIYVYTKKLSGNCYFEIVYRFVNVIPLSVTIQLNYLKTYERQRKTQQHRRPCRWLQIGKSFGIRWKLKQN